MFYTSTVQKQIKCFYCYLLCVSYYFLQKNEKKTFKAFEERQQKTDNRSFLIRQQKLMPQEIYLYNKLIFLKDYAMYIDNKTIQM